MIYTRMTKIKMIDNTRRRRKTGSSGTVKLVGVSAKKEHYIANIT